MILPKLYSINYSTTHRSIIYSYSFTEIYKKKDAEAETDVE
jgi:hypothetical protein